MAPFPVGGSRGLPESCGLSFMKSNLEALAESLTLWCTWLNMSGTVQRFYHNWRHMGIGTCWAWVVM